MPARAAAGHPGMSPRMIARTSASPGRMMTTTRTIASLRRTAKPSRWTMRSRQRRQRAMAARPRRQRRRTRVVSDTSVLCSPGSTCGREPRGCCRGGGSGHWSWGGNKRVGRKRRELEAVQLLKTRGHIPVSTMHVIPRHCSDESFECERARVDDAGCLSTCF